MNQDKTIERLRAKLAEKDAIIKELNKEIKTLKKKEEMTKIVMQILKEDIL